MNNADHAAFLEAIKASPDDDGLRLVYADYLRENGDPDRGDFIEVQVRLARMDRGVSGRGVNAHKADRRRERKLLDAHAERWADPVQVSRPLRPDLFRRGLLESLTLTAEAWLQHADAILAAHPVQEVRLTDEPGSEADFHEIRTLGGDHYWFHPRWSGVRFHLPARDLHPLLREPDYEGMFASAREAGRRAAMRQNEQFWEEFLSQTDRPR